MKAGGTPFAGPPAAQDIGYWAGVREIYDRMSRARRRQLFLLFGLMLLGAIAELASIGAVVPFLTLLADPSGLDRFPWAGSVFDALGAESRRERLVAATAMFCVFVIAAGFLRLQLNWFTQQFIFRLGNDLSVEVQRRILFQPYSFHVHRNTSSLLSAVGKAETVSIDLLLPLVQAATAAFVSVFIIAALVYIDPATATVAAAAFALIYLLVSGFAQRRLRRNSAQIATAWDERFKIVQESLGGIRDVIIDRSQPLYLRLFAGVSLRLSRARASTAFIAGAPRFVIETLGMVTIALIALAISRREGGLAGALPILGAIALGAQRLLPLLQQIYFAWSNAAGKRAVLAHTIELLRLPVADDEAQTARSTPLPLRDRISVEQLSFTYPTRRHRPALDEVTFDIAAGSTVALVGETGSGKSTLADLLMGLLEPDKGRICIDGVPLTAKNRRRWQRNIAHVPQSIFLADTSIARNIALSSPDAEIDMAGVDDAAGKAQLHEFVESLPEGYDTLVGERGVRLSGGQRQRLGIARALYKQAPVLILDEATSALDDSTESAVMRSLQGLGNESGLTIIIIAHRLSTVAGCDLVARFHEGRLVELGTFADVVG